MSGTLIRSGLLSDYFDGVVVKRLSAVEADARRSNQHEFNGVRALKNLLGEAEPKTISACFIWLGEEQEAISDIGSLTWYDARRDHPTRSEYRLYFRNTAVSEITSEGDVLFIAKRTDGTAMVIVTPFGETMQNQLLWLFGLPDQLGLDFFGREIESRTAAEMDFAARYIMDELGIALEEPEAEYLDTLLERFGAGFPTTSEFSAFARGTLSDVPVLEAPDETLIMWLEQEERLFRRLERHIVDDRLRAGFVSADGADIEGFLGFSLSVQNRRKSRAGFALENHLEEIFRAHLVRFNRNAETEHRAKPDFIFPGKAEYDNAEFPSAHLTMLGSKSTCKDRWRQVLSEAARIDRKHLLTLEPGISENQTVEMEANNLQLVLPKNLHETYRPNQQSWLMSLSEFIGLVQQRQQR